MDMEDKIWCGYLLPSKARSLEDLEELELYVNALLIMALKGMSSDSHPSPDLLQEDGVLDLRGLVDVKRKGPIPAGSGATISESSSV